MHTPVVISCNEGRREVSAIQNIANKQIDRSFFFDKVCCAKLFVIAFCVFVNAVFGSWRNVEENAR